GYDNTRTANRMLRLIAKAAGFLAYFLITLEMLFMVTPFALYYYSAYRPLLTIPSGFATTAWLPAFFLPHLSSDIFPNAGNLIFLLGLIGFLIGAIQVYRAKFYAGWCGGGRSLQTSPPSSVPFSRSRWSRAVDYLAAFHPPYYLCPHALVLLCSGAERGRSDGDSLRRRLPESKTTNLEVLAARAGRFLAAASIWLDPRSQNEISDELPLFPNCRNWHCIPPARAKSGCY